MRSYYLVVSASHIKNNWNESVIDNVNIKFTQHVTLMTLYVNLSQGDLAGYLNALIKIDLKGKFRRNQAKET